MHRLRALLGVAALACLATAVVAVEYVHTPVGLMRSDCVHKVGNGATVRENKAGRLDVHNVDGTYVRTLPKCLNQDVHPLLHPSSHLAQRLQARKTILTQDGVLPIQDPPVFPADYDGWEAYTAWNTSGGIDVFLGNFSVPDAPANAPDVLYLFTGLQNIDWIPERDPNPDGFDIIQPVLQTPADSGAPWSVKSWYVTIDDGAIQSNEIEVNPGDNIFGNMTQTGKTAWYIGSTVSSTGQTTVVNVDRPRLAGQFWAYNTLECYGCIDCTTYPKEPCVFSELVLQKDNQTLYPEWRLNPKPNPNLKCHETIVDITPESQSVVFQ